MNTVYTGKRYEFGKAKHNKALARALEYFDHSVAGKREIEVAAVQQRARQLEGLRITLSRQLCQCRSAGVTQAEHLGGLVEGLAGRVVDGLAQQRSPARRSSIASAYICSRAPWSPSRLNVSPQRTGQNRRPPVGSLRYSSSFVVPMNTFCLGTFTNLLP